LCAKRSSCGYKKRLLGIGSFQHYQFSHYPKELCMQLSPSHTQPCGGAYFIIKRKRKGFSKHAIPHFSNFPFLNGLSCQKFSLNGSTLLEGGTQEAHFHQPMRARLAPHLPIKAPNLTHFKLMSSSCGEGWWFSSIEKLSKLCAPVRLE